MFNYATNEVHYEGLRIPTSSLIGQEGKGFRYVLDGWNAERILLAAEAIGDGYWFVDRAASYARDRHVFGRPIGANQGVQFPIAQSYMQVRAADLMRVVTAPSRHTTMEIMTVPTAGPVPSETCTYWFRCGRHRPGLLRLAPSHAGRDRSHRGLGELRPWLGEDDLDAALARAAEEASRRKPA
jgi:alkylation response protein AidB-like acyl-CoA dehydrogenase